MKADKAQVVVLIESAHRSLHISQSCKILLDRDTGVHKIYNAKWSYNQWKNLTMDDSKRHLPQTYPKSWMVEFLDKC